LQRGQWAPLRTAAIWPAFWALTGDAADNAKPNEAATSRAFGFILAQVLSEKASL